MPRSTTRKTTTKKVLTMPAPAATMPAAPTSDDVARRAFELFCQRGHQHGYDVQDWLQAEREVRGAAASSAA